MITTAAALKEVTRRQQSYTKCPSRKRESGRWRPNSSANMCKRGSFATPHGRKPPPEAEVEHGQQERHDRRRVVAHVPGWPPRRTLRWRGPAWPYPRRRCAVGGRATDNGRGGVVGEVEPDTRSFRVHQGVGVVAARRRAASGAASAGCAATGRRPPRLSAQFDDGRARQQDARRATPAPRRRRPWKPLAGARRRGRRRRGSIAPAGCNRSATCRLN